MDKAGINEVTSRKKKSSCSRGDLNSRSSRCKRDALTTGPRKLDFMQLRVYVSYQGFSLKTLNKKLRVNLVSGLFCSC